ncbi:MAG: TonB family protein [bacterium]
MSTSPGTDAHDPTPDADALVRRGSIEQAGGNLDAAESRYREALQAREIAPESNEAALIGTLSALGRLLVARGAIEEGRFMLTRALALTDASDPAQEEELPLLINALIRIHLRQSDYAEAEPLLRRLLAIKEAQGEDRPEVATVVASLAGVRNAMGDYPAAETLYRRALRIREETLPPNHITVAATMESLSAACAARGHFPEALSLSTRALAMREVTLGAHDPSVRAAREHIADLQLQAPEEIGALRPVRTSPTSHPAQAFNGVPSARLVIPSVSEGSASVVVPSARPSEPAGEMQFAPRPPRVSDAPAEVESSRFAEAALPSVLVPWSNQLAAIQREIESDGSRDAEGGTSLKVVLATLVDRRSKTSIGVVVGVVALVAALGFKAQFGGRSATQEFVDAEPAKADRGAQPIAGAPNTPAAQVEATPSRALPAIAPAGSSARVNASASVAQQGGSVASAKSERPQAERSVALAAPALVLPHRIAPTIAVPDVDAGRAVNLPTRNLSDSFASRLSSSGVDGGARSDAGATPPRLIGSAPQPRYPERLREQHVAGEVLVQFTVNEDGRAEVASLKVLHSPHELLTSAVRAVLSQFRFEPARSGGAASKARAETVQYAFSFQEP